MIRAECGLDEAGLLRSCRISGHAGAGKPGSGGRGSTGKDVVCAAVSALTVAALRVFTDRKGITLKAAAPRRGETLFLLDYGAEGKEFLAAAGAFLLEGLGAVAEKHPEYCVLDIRRS